MTQKLREFEFESVYINKNSQILERKIKTGRSLMVPVNKATLEMVKIPAGVFMMGASVNEFEIRENETPQHKVSVSGFFMGKFPVTQRQWKTVLPLPKMGDNFCNDDLPVVNVWLEQAILFCAQLKEITNLPFRLPTEAEWEYACRAGTETAFSFGETISSDLANFNGHKPFENSVQGQFRQTTTPAGFFNVANDFGLYDMHGNVWEWCADIWHEDYLGAPTDGSAWTINGDQSYCVQRGGSWIDRGGACRSAFRVGDVARNTDNIVGLRLCLSDIIED